MTTKTEKVADSLKHQPGETWDEMFDQSHRAAGADAQGTNPMTHTDEAAAGPSERAATAASLMAARTREGLTDTDKAADKASWSSRRPVPGGRIGPLPVLLIGAAVGYVVHALMDFRPRTR